MIATMALLLAAALGARAAGGFDQGVDARGTLQALRSGGSAPPPVSGSPVAGGGGPAAAPQAPLRRETRVPLRRCEVSDAGLPLTRRYLQRVFERVAASDPGTFGGDLAPGLFCVMPDANDVGVRAWADPADRSVRVETGLLLLAGNDAQVAAVLSHELAHITMRNVLCDATPLRDGAAELVELQCEHDRLLEEQNSLGKDVRSPAGQERLQRLIAQVGELERRIHSILAGRLGPEAAANWLEVEADEVGRRLFLGAGFDEGESLWRHEQIALWPPGGTPPAQGGPASAAERRAGALRACGLDAPGAAEPARGTQRYASNCWSLWNALARPGAGGGGSGDVSLPSGEPTLAQAQDEIRRRPPPPPVK